MDDPFNLQRFVDAQNTRFAAAFAEIRGGAKRGHWMWFIFPQLAALGQSAMAKHYGIGSIEEAAAYLQHPLLGSRLRACVAALQTLPNPDAITVFGSIDALKLGSSLTLFSAASGDPLFTNAISRWCGDQDQATLRLLREISAEAETKRNRGVRFE
jgi:uncharacterized protein (DUF1810 family)